MTGREPAARVLAAQVVVIAKEPVPGRVKTRLTPPFTPVEAAALAEAALADTLATVASAGIARRVLALQGTPGRWLPPGFDVISQRGAGLDERIAAALADTWAAWPAPVLLIGMDTPQVTPELLVQAAEPLVSGAADATFGPAEDGGFWLLGLREIDPALVLGVPMSRADTGSLQLARLTGAGLRVQLAPVLADVDTAAEAERIAAAVPGSRFSACLAAMRDAGLSAYPPAVLAAMRGAGLSAYPPAVLAAIRGAELSAYPPAVLPAVRGSEPSARPLAPPSGHGPSALVALSK